MQNSSILAPGTHAKQRTLPAFSRRPSMMHGSRKTRYGRKEHWKTLLELVKKPHCPCPSGPDFCSLAKVLGHFFDNLLGHFLGHFTDHFRDLHLWHFHNHFLRRRLVSLIAVFRWFWSRSSSPERAKGWSKRRLNGALVAS